MLSIKLEAHAGQNVDDIIKECYRVACHLGIMVECRINGLDLYISKNSNVTDEIERYQEFIKRAYSSG